MLVAVVSDTHRMDKYIKATKEVILNEGADVIIHLGDNSEDIELLTDGFEGKLYGVRGNCDCLGSYPKELLVELNGKKIFMCHGDAYGVKFGLNNIYFKGMQVEADIVLFGHTHQAMIEKHDSITLMNPGSVSLPRFKGRTIGFINIKANGETDIYLKEIL